jgi:hypothetical protein
VGQARHASLGTRTGRLDPHLDRELERPDAVVWQKTADEILDSLAAYCQRINDSGH